MPVFRAGKASKRLYSSWTSRLPCFLGMLTDALHAPSSFGSQLGYLPERPISPLQRCLGFLHT